jgi:LuxR family maltose regulon positive regulatory protein
MATPLLATKLYIPPVRPELVTRPRLVERLNAGLFGSSASLSEGRGLRKGSGLQKGWSFARKLTLISAPAGFGKTTLLSEWVADFGLTPAGGKPESKVQDQESKIRVAWLSLDQGDNDPVRFLAYLIAAFQTIEESVGRGALGVLQSPGFAKANTPPPVEELLTALINQINAIPGGCVLVLDDYHLVTAQLIHDALAFLLDHMPANLHLVIATRADPPLPIARLRGRGELTELRQPDLRFTPEEVTEFLNRAMGLELSGDEVVALASRTEGWIAGLQMAALAMQRQDAGRTSGFIQAFTGSHRYILDYLVEEVLQRQPSSVQAFLLQTAILDRMTAPLCDAVIESQRISESANQRADDLPICRFADLQFADLSGKEILEYLDRHNLFVVPLDNERRWYRYHRLFADLLRARLHQEMGAQGRASLHRRASAWYEHNGLEPLAIDHALAAGDFERAAHLIEQTAEATLMRSEGVTFLNWVEALPDELVRARPTLCLFHAWALLMGGHPPDAVESRLQDIEGDTDLISGQVDTLRGFIAAFQGRASYASELSRQALEQLPEGDSFFRGIAAWNLSISHMLSGDVAATGQAFDEAARVGQETGNVMVAVMALCHLAEARRAQGQLHEATEIYQQAAALAVDEQGRPLPVAGMALIGLGELSREWNDLEAAARYLVEGIELSSQWGEFGTLDGYVYLARVRQAQGDEQGARDAIQKAQQIAIQFEATELDDIAVAACQARLWAAQGDIEAAMRWAEERGLEAATGATELEEGGLFYDHMMRQYEYITLARVLLAQGRPDEALPLLEPALAMLEQQGRHEGVLKLEILRAVTFQVQGDVVQAMVCLEHALSLAEPGGYVRAFVDEGEPMRELLRQPASRGIAPEYVSRLLAAFERGTKDQGPTTKAEDSPSVFRSSDKLRAGSFDKLRAGSSSVLVEPLSEREFEVLRLLTTHLSSTEIAKELCISANTVRFHIKNIYGKLGVHRRSDAIDRASELGLL